MVTLHHSTRLIAGVIVCATALCSVVTPQAHAASAASRVSLVGTWLGNALGDTGGCGSEYGQFTFFRNGEYAYTENSEECGGITNAGSYQVRNGVLSLHWTECNYPCRPGTASIEFELRGVNTFELYDAGLAYYYYRQ